MSTSIRSSFEQIIRVFTEVASDFCEETGKTSKLDGDGLRNLINVVPTATIVIVIVIASR